MLGDFSEEDIKTERESAVFIRDVLLISISLIVRKRKLVPEQHFDRKSINGYLIGLLSEKTCFGRNAIASVDGAYEALREGYLEKFILVVSYDHKNPDSVLEAFTWTFNYIDKRIEAIFSSPNSPVQKITYEKIDITKKQVVQMMKFLNAILVDNPVELPPESYAGIRLVYNEDRQYGWQAPGFIRSQSLYTFEGKSRCLGDHTVNTAFHSSSFRIESAEAIQKHRPPSQINTETLLDNSDIDDEEMEAIEEFRAGEADTDEPYDDIQSSESFLHSSENSYVDTSVLGTYDSKSPKRRFTSPSSSEMSYQKLAAKKPIAKKTRLQLSMKNSSNQRIPQKNS